jgi:cytochrome c5
MTNIRSVRLGPCAPLTNKVNGSTRSGNLRSFLIALAACLLAMALLVACSPRSSQPSSPAATALPAETSALSGAALLEERCSVCHSADRAKQAHKTSDEWDATVTRMIGKGAQLTNAEKKVLVDYLAATYGP